MLLFMMRFVCIEVSTDIALSFKLVQLFLRHYATWRRKQETGSLLLLSELYSWILKSHRKLSLPRFNRLTIDVWRLRSTQTLLQQGEELVMVKITILHVEVK